MIGDILRAHGLKKTPIRSEILLHFMKCDFALSAGDLITKMNERHDKVTIYRALHSFEENGILHRASEDGSGVKYALCSRQCPDKQHTDAHVHFICDECHNTYCLEHVEVPEVDLSNEFSVKRVNYTVSGICKECKG